MDHWEPSNNYESNHQMNLQIDNPLTRITLDQPIHELITFHLMQRHVSPFQIDNAASLSAKIFYTSFVFGLLTFIDSKPGPKTTLMYQWKLNDTLEIMAAYNKTLDNVVLYIHEINFARVFRGSSVFRQQHPNYNRLAALKSYVESELRSTLPIQTITVYKYEMFAQRVNGSPQIGFGMTMNDHQIFSGDIVTTNNFSWDKFKLITPSGNGTTQQIKFANLLQDLSKVVGEPSIDLLGDAVENALSYSYTNEVTKTLQSPFLNQYELQMGVIGFLHGALFPALPNDYYRRVMKSKIEPIQASDAVVFIYLTASPKMSHKHIYIDCIQNNRSHNDYAYKILENLKLDHQKAKILHIWLSLEGNHASVKKQTLVDTTNILSPNTSLTNMLNIRTFNAEQKYRKHDHATRNKRGSYENTFQRQWNKNDFNVEIIPDKYDPLLVQFVQQVSIVHELDDQLQEAFASRQSLSEMGDSKLKNISAWAFFNGWGLVQNYFGGKIKQYGVSVQLNGQQTRGAAVEGGGECLRALKGVAYQTYQLYGMTEAGDTRDANFVYLNLVKDSALCGARYLGAMSLLSRVAVGSVEGANLLLTIGSLLVQRTKAGMDKVISIEEIMPLQSDEKAFVFTRTFFFFGLDNIMEGMIRQVKANEAAALRAAKQFPNIDRFLVSAATQINDDQSLSYFDDNTIDLTVTQTFSKSRLMPRDEILGPNFSTFCSLNDDMNIGKEELAEKVLKFVGFGAFFADHYKNPVYEHLCRNSFGLMKKKENREAKTLFLLYNSTDSVVGFHESKNIFLLMDGNKTIRGGVETDEFLIQSGHIFGLLDGSEGQDIVDLSGMIYGNEDLIIKNGRASFPPLVDEHKILELRSIEVVLGRIDRRDQIEVCNEAAIDLKGSVDSTDMISVSHNCGRDNRQLNIVLNHNTLVECTDPNSEIQYQVFEHLVWSSVLKLSAGKHVIYFPTTQVKNTKLFYNGEIHGIVFGPKSELIVQFLEKTVNVTLVFVQEGITVKLEGSNFTLYSTNEWDIFYIMRKYATFIQNNHHLSLIAKTEQGTVSLHHNLFTMETNSGEKQQIFFPMEI